MLRMEMILKGDLTQRLLHEAEHVIAVTENHVYSYKDRFNSVPTPALRPDEAVRYYIGFYKRPTTDVEEVLKQHRQVEEDNP